MTAEPLQLDNPFWCFSLAVYGRGDVREACLAVQDRLRGDVNLLLYCAWCGAARGLALGDAAIAELERAIADWNRTAVQPLRAVRQGIKALPAYGDAAVIALRKDVAALELRAEQVAQAMLYAQTFAMGEAPGNAEVAAANVRRYMARIEQNAAVPAGGVNVDALIHAARAFRS